MAVYTARFVSDQVGNQNVGFLMTWLIYSPAIGTFTTWAKMTTDEDGSGCVSTKHVKNSVQSFMFWTDKSNYTTSADLDDQTALREIRVYTAHNSICIWDGIPLW